MGWWAGMMRSSEDLYNKIEPIMTLIKKRLLFYRQIFRMANDCLTKSSKFHQTKYNKNCGGSRNVKTIQGRSVSQKVKLMIDKFSRKLIQVLNFKLESEPRRQRGPLSEDIRRHG